MTGPCLTSRLVIRFFGTIPFVRNKNRHIQLFSSSRSPYHMLLSYIPLGTKHRSRGTRTMKPVMTSTPGSKPAAIRTGHTVKLITRMKATRHQVPGAGAGLNVWFLEK